MGLQEHAGDMEQKPDEDLDAQGEEEQEPVSTEEASADSEQSEKQDEAKEEGPKTKVEQVVSDAVDQYGPEPPVDKMVELAGVFGYIPGQPEYDQFLDAVQKFCGNDYCEALEAEFDAVTAEPEANADQEADGDAPPEQNEADAAKDDDAQGDAAKEENEQDPAALEQEGPAAEEVPPELADAPAIQEEVAAKGDEAQEEAPAAEDVKDQNAEEAESESTEEVAADEEVDAAPPAGDLRRGDQSPEVEELQNMLVAAGLMTQEDMDTGPGIFGPRTERALKAYQESQGLPATGFYGPQTRESLAQAAQPASPTAQIVQDLVANNGPQPDFAIMVGAFTIVDAAVQPEFMTEVALQCGDDYAAQLQQQLDEAASAPAEEAAPDADKQSDQDAAKQPADDADKEADAPAAAAPEQEVETNAAPEEVVDAKAEVVEVAPDVVPDDAKEEVAQKEEQPVAEDGAAKDEEAEQENEQTETDLAKVQEEEQAKDSDDVAAAPDADPAEKEQAAAEQEEQLAEAPADAKVEDADATKQSEEELNTQKDQTENDLAAKAAEEAATADTLSSLQALIEEADSLLEAGMAVLADPVLDTTQADIQADAESMLSDWDRDLEIYAAQLTALADKLLTPDLGAAGGSQDVVAASAAKANELRDKAASLAGSAPSKVTVNAQLQDGSVLSFEAPISDRNSAVQDILKAFNDQLALHEGEKKGEDAPAAAPEDPNATA